MKKSIIIISLFFVSFLSFSQEALKSTEEEYYDFLSLSGLVERPTLGYRTLSDSEWIFTDTDADHPWKNNNLGTKKTLWTSENQGNNWFTKGFEHSLKLKIYGPEWFNSYNTACPYGQNDGALWQGRGYNSSLTAGARLEAFGFEITLKPMVCFSENRSFKLMDNSEYYSNKYAYIWGYGADAGIDLPQRFGDSSFWTFDWGDSEIRWTWHTFTIGFGFQNPWLGPAWLNPMLGSNNAASYPKIDIGLRRTKVYLPFCGWYIGDIEGRIWNGLLTESEYFDENPKNDTRMLNAISASYKPSFIPGFSIGANRIFITNWSSHNFKYIGRLFSLGKVNTNGSLTGNKEDEDQKVSLFIDWLFPKAGFEFYGELGIDDFTSHNLSNPFHTAIYTIGAKQEIPLNFSKLNPKFKNLKSQLIFEWNNFEMSQDYQMEYHYMGYYAHSNISQGYTQKGQILGAGSGYFGNSQFLAYKIFTDWGYIMPFFHRHCPDNNYIYNMSIGENIDNHSAEYEEHYGTFKTYMTGGADINYFINNSFSLTTNIACNYVNFPTYSRNKVYFTNINLSFNAKYIF